MPLSTVPTIRRAGTKRSRTGCRTCRARRVKCDETPVACRNCTSTGRQCDGYDPHRLPIRWRRGSKKNNAVTYLQPARDPGKTVAWAMTSDERQCFAYFHGHTVPTLLQFFDSDLWQKLVPQLTRNEPPVYHAVVGLSAIHWSCEKSGMRLATPASILVEDALNHFAQEQLGRSIASLNRRCASQDPYIRHVILVCCLLFVIADLLRGRYEEGLSHLRSGISIIKELQGYNVSSQSLIEQPLISAFAHLDILASHYNNTFPMFSPDNLPGSTQPISSVIPHTGAHFRSLPEVRIAFDNLLRCIYRFCSRYFGAPESEIALYYESLQAEQIQILSWMLHFKQYFEPFYVNFYPSLTAKEQLGLDIIKLHLLSSPIGLKSMLLGNNKAPLAYYTSDLATVCSLAEQIMSKIPERPSVTIDNGILPPLFHACTLCCDYTIRWWAFELLQSWPHREGPFDSNWMAYLCGEMLKLDLEVLCDADPGFRDRLFVLRDGKELSVHKMLTEITFSQQKQLDGLGGRRFVQHIPDHPASAFLNNFAELKGMRGWSCVRAYTAATSRKANCSV
ncbi:hypothetical protein BDV59DRAFT_210748 [Aspergillus ambiguus]|uniref:Zn(II)2Cys6 transcription factor n=1 Tax=Aspergillus ambiguus TaxID=176160 RepID=UPI003CCCCAB4